MNKDTTLTAQTDEELLMGEISDIMHLYRQAETIHDRVEGVKKMHDFLKSHREEYADKQVKEVLENLEPLTHNGRGTILWEMDVLCDALNEELARLSKKDPKVTEKSVGNPKFGKVS